MLRKKKLAHFPVQFKELFAVCAGVIGYTVDLWANIQKAYYSHLKNSTSEGKRKTLLSLSEKEKEIFHFIS